MTCHAAIVSRELGIPCVVGTVEATTTLHDGDVVTVDAGSGVVTEGATARAPRAPRIPADPCAALQPLRTKLLVNLSEPSQLDRVRDLDVDGVGLLRAELMIVEALEGEHPRALMERGEGELFVERMADSLRHFSTRVRRLARSPTGRSTSAPTSSAACAAASASSRRRRTR